MYLEQKKNYLIKNTKKKHNKKKKSALKNIIKKNVVKSIQNSMQLFKNFQLNLINTVKNSLIFFSKLYTVQYILFTFKTNIEKSRSKLFVQYFINDQIPY